ncbi:hypothetical protein [Acinetobacter sp. SA01]|uniref:hypothetical protein n=1 Tax=Acinetobacter sp. SA01 TaxID=1862567 RepID=UPI00140AF265|nr:hypothetical protein [Acinetobacter sp. SA01]
MSRQNEQLKEIVSYLLKNPAITIQEIENQVLVHGGIMKLQGGDENHGTYSIFRKYHKSQIDITKCHCGHIHLLEDMCIKCHPDWAVTFYKDGSIKLNPDFTQSLQEDDLGLPF